MKNKIFCLILITIFLFNLSCFKKVNKIEPVKISFKLDWKNGVQFAGYYVAQYKSYYKDENLIVEFSNAKTSQEVVAIPYQVEKGEIDLATGSMALTLAQVNGSKLTVVSSIYQYGPHVLFAKTNKGINSVKDLKGHTVVDKGSSWRDPIKKILEYAGLNINDIKFIKGGFDMTPFYNDEIDVWTGYLIDEVPRARLKGYDLITFPLYEYGIINIGGSIYGSNDYIEKNPEILTKFLKASIKGWEFAVTNPDETVSIIQKMFPDIKDGKDFLLMSLSASIPLIKIPGKPIGYIDCEAYNKLLRNIYKIDNKNFCTDKFINKVYSNE